MLKRLVNECRFTLKITTKGPFIIREGRLEKSVTGKPDNIPVRLGPWRDGDDSDFHWNQRYYLPGTSLRGVIRSHAERIVRTLAPGQNLCCDPFRQESGGDQSCSHWLADFQKKAKATEVFLREVYRRSCAICRLFGSTSQASRIRISDSEPVTINENQWSIREHIAIDRFTGGAKQGVLFSDLVLEDLTFENDVVIRNFELWQLGLLAYVLRDFLCWEDGLIRLGYGKTKGYGLVQGTVEQVSIVYYEKASPHQTTRKLSDMGDILADEKSYDFFPGQCTRNDLLTREGGGLYYTSWKITKDKNLAAFWSECAAAWGRALKKFKQENTLNQLRQLPPAEEAPLEETAS